MTRVCISKSILSDLIKIKKVIQPEMTVKSHPIAVSDKKLRVILSLPHRYVQTTPLHFIQIKTKHIPMVMYYLT